MRYVRYSRIEEISPLSRDFIDSPEFNDQKRELLGMSRFCLLSEREREGERQRPKTTKT